MLNPSDTRQLISDTLAQLPNVAANAPLRAQLTAALAQSNVIGKPYTRSISFASLATGQGGAQNMAVDAAAAFIIQASTYSANVAGAAQTVSTAVIPLVNVLLSDTGTGENFSDAAVPVVCMFGTGEEPFIWPTPRVIPANATISATPNNVSAATTYNLTLCFHGVRLLKQG